MDATHIGDSLTGVLARFDLELEAVEIAPSGRRTRLRVVVDGDGPDGRGPGLDDLAEATRAVSAALDETNVTGNTPYTLEVTSRGTARPLTKPQHWRRNRGRLVTVTRADEAPLTGRIVGNTDTAVTLSIDGAEREFALADIGKAVIQVEFRKVDRVTEIMHEELED